MIVVDASAFIKYILREDGWNDISVFIREKRPLYSVDHLLKECFNAIWRHCYLRKSIDRGVAIDLVNKISKLIDSGVIVLEPEDKYLSKALEIALDMGLTIYDSLYLAQALLHGEILTSDKKQAEIAESLGVKTYLVE